MSDSIERQAAKEAYCKKFCHPGVLCHDSGFCREVDEAFDPVPSAQPKPHWIPCSERLPEERGFYLVKVCAEYRPIRIYAFSPWDMDKERKFWINDSDSHSHVFNHFVEAWMPLPEPYKAERRTDETD